MHSVKSDNSDQNLIPAAKHTGIKLVVLISYLLMIVLNALANILPINGITTGGVSDNYSNLFTPAGFTFSIWGLIYVLLAFFTIYQFVIKIRKSADQAEKKINIESTDPAEPLKNEQNSHDLQPQADSFSVNYVRVLFIISSVINAVWIFSWHYEFIGISLILMLALLVCLVLIHIHLRKPGLSFRDKLLVRLPFSVYLGWITVATVANATVWLVSIGWQGWTIPESVWTIIAIAAAVLISLAVIATSRDFAYGLVIIWALFGILSRHLDSSGFNGDFPSVIISISIALAIMAVASILALLGKKLRLVSGKKLHQTEKNKIT